MYNDATSLQNGQQSSNWQHAGRLTVSRRLDSGAQATVTLPDDWQTVSELQSFNVKVYGAMGDGVTDDSAAIQAALNAVPNTGGSVFFPRGTYIVNTSLSLPVGISGNPYTYYLVEGYAAVLTTTTPGVVLLGGLPVDQTQASQRAVRRFFIRGMTFVGSRQAGQVGLQIAGSYGSIIEGCTFSSLDTGLDLEFALMTSVRSCMGYNNVSDTFVARNGTWSGAGLNNSASNHTSFWQCRDYAGVGQLRQFYVYATTGVALHDCIVEGANPVDAVVFDSGGSPTVKYFAVNNLHGENTPTHDVIWAPPHGGLVRIEGLLQQAVPGNAVIDVTGTTGGGFVHVSNIPYWLGSAGKLCTTLNDGLRWQFDTLYGTFDPSDPTYWVGGTMGQFWWVMEDTGGTPMLKSNGGYLVSTPSPITLTSTSSFTFPNKLAIGALPAATINVNSLPNNSLYFYRDEPTKRLYMHTVDNAGVRTLVSLGSYTTSGFGRITKSVAGGADVTLSTTESLNNIYEFTGALTASINVIVPIESGFQFTVFNNTTGAFTLTVKGATGTGIAIGQTKRAMLYADGTNIVRATADV